MFQQMMNSEKIKYSNHTWQVRLKNQLQMVLKLCLKIDIHLVMPSTILNILLFSRDSGQTFWVGKLFLDTYSLVESKYHLVQFSFFNEHV